jgi:hypothetical protein
MWRNIRLAILVGILFFVAVGSWLDQHGDRLAARCVSARSRSAPTAVGHPGQHCGADAARLQPVSDLPREAHRYGVAIDEPIDIKLYPPVASAPPILDPEAGPLDACCGACACAITAQAIGSISSTADRAVPGVHDPTCPGAAAFRRAAA